MMRFSASIALVFLFSCVAHTATAQTPATARQILDKTISVYNSCNTYLDAGEVRTIFIDQNKQRRTVVKPFTTAFERTGNFRFEYQDRRGENEWNRYVIWKGGDSIKTFWTIKPDMETPQNLDFALGEAAGVSDLSSVIIPGLLIPEIKFGKLINSLADLKQLGEENINNKTAYKIEGLDSRQNPINVWIDKDSSLILKVFRKNHFDKFDTESTITYQPEINVKVERKKLAFGESE